MIIVRVELHSAQNGKVTELARMKICNDGKSTNYNFGNYLFQTFRGKSKDRLDCSIESKNTFIEHWPRERFHVWNLVCKGLRQMGYVDGWNK